MRQAFGTCRRAHTGCRNRNCRGANDMAAEVANDRASVRIKPPPLSGVNRQSDNTYTNAIRIVPDCPTPNACSSLPAPAR
jgi:hypothetical protein